MIDENQNIVYKDDKTGEKLYGYSVEDHAKLVRHTKLAVILGYLFFGFVLFLFWYIIHVGFFNNVLRELKQIKCI